MTLLDGSMASYSAYALLHLGLAGGAVQLFRWVDARAAARANSLESLLRELDAIPVEHSGTGLDRDRLKLRRRDMAGFSYADLKGDRPYVPPGTEAGADVVDVAVESLVRRKPDVAAKLQEIAHRQARAKGAITSDDIWSAIEADPDLKRQVEESPKIIAAAWRPRKLWVKTGVYLPTARPEANKRPIAQWRLKDAVAA